MPDRLIDNRNRKLGDHLRERLRGAGALRVVSAYFNIHGFEILADQIERLAETRFLYGNGGSIEDTGAEHDQGRAFELIEKRLKPTEALKQKPLAARCAQWVGRESVHVRAVKNSRFLHGKMWLIDKENAPCAVVGSSNFTRRGLGGGDQSNMEINLAVEDPQTSAELTEWFDALWDDPQQVEDVKKQVLDALNRIAKEWGAESVYFKTLYELFKDQTYLLDDQDARLSDLKESQIWKALFDFQRHGALNALNALEKHNGCLLADSVGLGKTYTALAVVKQYELLNKNVMVICPRKLREQWEFYLAAAHRPGNPFQRDRFDYALLSHTDLSRESGMAGLINLEDFNWSSFGLIVIDESHNFRNDGGSRYKKLINEAIRKGAPTKVLMLSATPVNTGLIDLGSQFKLIAGGDDKAFEETLRVRSVRETLRAAQMRLSRAEERSKTEILESLGADFQALLGALTIARSRKHIRESYGSEMQKIGHFPERLPPDNRNPKTDAKGELSYEELSKQIEEFQLSVYRPSDYLKSENPLFEARDTLPRQQQREKYLIGMIRVNFLKRLESSPHSLKLTLERTIKKIDRLLEKIEAYRGRESEPQTLREVEDPFDDEQKEEDEELIVNRGKKPYRLHELHIERWKEDILQDKVALQKALEMVAAVGPERDGKLAEIQEILRGRVQNPTQDSNGDPVRKLIVFTTYKDTAKYLYEQLQPLAKELSIPTAMVAGDETHTQAGRNDFHTILNNFAPKSRLGKGAETDAPIDLLIATDCVSEGLNLHDCDRIVNYDIHWNPVRLIQRLGRIDRIGSDSESIQMINFWPTADMEAYLKLESRVRARMALADAAATGEDNPLEFNEESAERELSFRDKQLLRMKTEALDLEELIETPSMSDFSFARFIGQLRNFLDSKKTQLENMPYGAYAVVKENPELPAGALFVLRQTNAGDDKNARNASPVAPHYVLYVQDDGEILHGSANAAQTLDMFEAAARGKTEPIQGMHDLFNRETNNGQRMERFDKLVQSCAQRIQEEFDDAVSQELGGDDRNYKLPIDDTVPKEAGDFQLIAWLVIIDPEHPRY